MTSPLTVEQQVLVALRRITRAIHLHSRLLLQECGLTSPQLAALQVLGRMQPICAGTLARELRLSQGTVTGILGRLEKRALIHRTRATRDRRSVRLELTDAGAKLLEEAPSLLQDRFRRELSRLEPWERTMIVATLQRVAVMMDAEPVQPIPVFVTDVAAVGEKHLTPTLQSAVVPGNRTSFDAGASRAVGASNSENRHGKTDRVNQGSTFGPRKRTRKIGAVRCLK
jgi:DNA-binding MarR family transcriptional regulator